MARKTGRAIHESSPTHRAAIASSVIAIIIVVVVAAIAGGAYFLASPNRSSSTASSSSRSTLSLSSKSSSHSGSGASKTYTGTFTYVNPLGPFGINESGGKILEWNSTQSASGTFTFTINPANYTGTGKGQGSITVNTQGYCTGSVTVQYTFTIEAVAPPPQVENMTVSFNTPIPSTAMVQLTCKGSTAGFNTANNPVTFLSVYPNGLSIGSFPATFSQQPTAGISYTVRVSQSG